MFCPFCGSQLPPSAFNDPMARHCYECSKDIYVTAQPTGSTALRIQWETQTQQMSLKYVHACTIYATDQGGVEERLGRLKGFNMNIDLLVRLLSRYTEIVKVDLPKD